MSGPNKKVTGSNTIVIKNPHFTPKDFTVKPKEVDKSMKKKKKKETASGSPSSSSKTSKRKVLVEIKDVLLKLVNVL